MANSCCSWRGWGTTVQWPPDLASDVRDRLSAFLDVVLWHVDALAARCDGADNVALIAALCAYIQQLDPLDRVNELVAVVHEQAIGAANAAHVQAWTAIMTDLLETTAMPVRWAVASILLERVLRATIVSRVEAFEPEVVVTAANDLERAVQFLLSAVLTPAVPPNFYRAM